MNVFIDTDIVFVDDSIVDVIVYVVNFSEGVERRQSVVIVVVIGMIAVLNAKRNLFNRMF